MLFWEDQNKNNAECGYLHNEFFYKIKNLEMNSILVSVHSFVAISSLNINFPYVTDISLLECFEKATESIMTESKK